MPRTWEPPDRDYYHAFPYHKSDQLWCRETRMAKQTRIEILRNRIKAAEDAWRWCRANGRTAAPASREMHAALAELKRLIADENRGQK
jgi:hypothetical protein